MDHARGVDIPGDAEVVILGAGPAGLAAGWELAEAGRSTLLVEAEAEPGGLCRTFERDGFRFDQGGHRFITRNRALYERVRGLLGEALRLRERRSVVRIGDREYRYPLDLGEVLAGEGVFGIARIVASYLAGRACRAVAARRAGAGSLETWMRERFGGAIFERFFKDYTRKLWGRGAGEMSADWAGARIAELDLKALVLHALGRRADPPRTFAAKYCYPRRGIGQIFAAAAERYLGAGGAIALAARAAAVRPASRPGGPIAVELQTAAGPRRVCCRRLISTIPLPELAAICGAPGETLAAAARLRFRSLRFLNLLLDGAPLSASTWIYVPEKEYLMTRIQFPVNRSPENCPPGRTSLQLEIPCDHGDAVWSAPEAELCERALDELARLGFDIGSRLLGSFTTAARHAYPVYERGYREARAAVAGWIGSLPGIETCGRQGGFSYIFLDRAMEEGFRAARRILGREDPQETANGAGAGPLLPEEAHSIFEGDAGAGSSR